MVLVGHRTPVRAGVAHSVTSELPSMPTERCPSSVDHGARRGHTLLSSSRFSIVLLVPFKQQPTPSNMPFLLSPEQQALVQQANPETGLSTDQAAAQRERDGSFNVVRPPVDCPAWLCILLPCISSLRSMKAFSVMKPDDAEVLRNGKWIRYDAASLVTADVIRLEEGDVVPADAVVLQVLSADEFLVDARAVTGDDKPSSAGDDALPIYWGSTVVQGSALAVVTAIGPHTHVAGLIRDGRFPPQPDTMQAIPLRDMA